MREPHEATRRALQRAYLDNDSTAFARLVLRALRAGHRRADFYDRDSPFFDELLDFEGKALANWTEKAAGVLYVATNPAFPELYKIGKTARPLCKRIAELSGPGVPEMFRPHCYWHVPDRHYAESTAHRLIASHRHRGELYHGPLDVLVAACRAVVTAEARIFETRISSTSSLKALNHEHE